MFEKPTIVEVAIAVPVDRLFDYSVPDELRDNAKIGHRVTIPFGRRNVQGFVVGVKDKSDVPTNKLKPIQRAPDSEPLFNQGILRLTQWMSEYYACSWGEALEAAIPSVIRTGRKRRMVSVVRCGKPAHELLERAIELEEKVKDSGKTNGPNAKHAKILRTLGTFDDQFVVNELAETLGYSPAPIRTLAKQGWLIIDRVEAEHSPPSLEVNPPTEDATLNDEQKTAVHAITASAEKDEFKTFLLFGVTGSGKTEVYIQSIRKILELGKSAIVLVPEISLTPQTTRRFAARFENVTVIHSGLTDAERRNAWREIREGRSRVVIGPRSALFAPVKDLGIIVVDEEHEPTYKQDNTPRYHARDTAIMRCQLENAVVILGSATPSMESIINALNGKSVLVELTHRFRDETRHGELAKVEIIDMAQECREQQRYTFMSRRLRGGIHNALERGEQAIIFLNRRGYHTMLMCKNCGSTMSCPHCDAPMSYHRTLRKAVCHYCLETNAGLNECSVCGMGPIRSMGAGTERLEEELKSIFVDHRVTRMDSDVMKTREDYVKALDEFRRGDSQILVGTQMIAKGLDFPNVTLVGVISADVGLSLGDFRAFERAFQLLTQVSGRAGRGDKLGTVIVQTFQPDHVAIRAGARQNYHEFLKHEMPQRKDFHYPPYSRLVLVIVEARNEQRAVDHATQMFRAAQDYNHRHPGALYEVSEPFDAPFSKLRGRYRQQVLIKARNTRDVADVVDVLRPYVKHQENLRVILDIDPASML